MTAWAKRERNKRKNDWGTYNNADDQSIVYKSMSVYIVPHTTFIDNQLNTNQVQWVLFTDGLSFAPLLFLWVDSQYSCSPLFSLYRFFKLVGWCGWYSQHRETLLVEWCWKTKRNLWSSSLHSLFAHIDWLSCRWALSPFCLLNKIRVSLYARANIFFTKCFHSLIFILFPWETTFTTTSFLYQLGYLFASAAQDDLLVEKVLLYSLHVRNTSALSSSYPSCRVLIPCYCMCYPN